MMWKEMTSCCMCYSNGLFAQRYPGICISDIVRYDITVNSESSASSICIRTVLPQDLVSFLTY